MKAAIRIVLKKIPVGLVFLALIRFCVTPVYAQEVSIALFYHRPLAQVIFTPEQNNYEIITSDRVRDTLEAGTSVYLSAVDSVVALYRPGKSTIKDHSLWLRPVVSDTGTARFRLAPINVDQQAYTYPGSLLLKADHGILLPVNHVSQEAYVAAVTEAEIGGKASVASIEAQAILVRTFLATAATRHQDEGFDICDGVHCQAYRGAGPDYQSVLAITRKTAGSILTGSDGRPAIIAYHSNSGGETADARQVWLAPMPYLKSVRDPYSLKGVHAHWQKELSLDTLRQVLTDLGMDAAGTLPPKAFEDVSLHRRPDYLPSQGGVPFRLLREKLELPSAFFSVTVKNNKVILNGHGYGHGLGLSQEGAMEMAKEGFSAVQILQFYFPGIRIR